MPSQRDLAEKALAHHRKHVNPQLHHGQQIEDPLLDDSDAARYLNTSPRTMQRWRQEGTGPQFCKLGHLVRYRRSWLDAYVHGQIRSSTSNVAA